MNERAIEIESDGCRLSGTVCLPDGEAPRLVVLMVHGSGPLDRNENMRGQELNVFNTLAHELAAVGVASVRYDKRGCGDSAGDYYRAGHGQLVDDATHWVDAIQGSDELGEVYLLGHSEGCLIAAEASSVRDVAGIVLVCPFLEDMKSILLRQARQLQHEVDRAEGVGGWLQRTIFSVLGQPLASQRKLLARLEGSRADTFRIGLQKVPAKWFRELIALDNRSVFEKVRTPTLVIGGEKDLQCDPEDVDRIAALIVGDVEAHRIQDMTHVLRCDDETPSLMGCARLLKEPVEPLVVEYVQSWLTSGESKLRGTSCPIHKGSTS